jgi:hypothetical protein
MIRISWLFSGLLTVGGAILADSAFAANEPEPTATNRLWPCGASLLPCRLPRTTPVMTLPYWRIDQPNRPIRASYTPAFSNRKTR